MRIEVSDLAVRRGGRLVLDGVSLKVEPGQTVALVGPNGAGKTTLLLAMLGLLPAERGRVTIDGRPVESLSRREIARRVAYVPQFHEGFLGFRVRDIIATGRYAHVEPLAPLSAEDEAAIRAAVDRCGVREFLDRTADTLSGGERQKVWLATAVAQGSPALFLDEPTNMLDPRHFAELVRLLRELAASGRTIVVVCHDLNLPGLLDARVAGLRGGRVAFEGSTADFLQPGRLAAMFDAPFAWARDERTGRTFVYVDTALAPGAGGVDRARLLADS